MHCQPFIGNCVGDDHFFKRTHSSSHWSKNFLPKSAESSSFLSAFPCSIYYFMHFELLNKWPRCRNMCYWCPALMCHCVLDWMNEACLVDSIFCVLGNNMSIVAPQQNVSQSHFSRASRWILFLILRKLCKPNYFSLHCMIYTFQSGGWVKFRCILQTFTYWIQIYSSVTKNLSKAPAKRNIHGIKLICFVCDTMNLYMFTYNCYFASHYKILWFRRYQGILG